MFRRGHACVVADVTAPLCETVALLFVDSTVKWEMSPRPPCVSSLSLPCRQQRPVASGAKPEGPGAGGAQRGERHLEVMLAFRQRPRTVYLQPQVKSLGGVGVGRRLSIYLWNR